MYRRVKGLLSLTLTFAMVAGTVAPVSADGLVSEAQQPAEEQQVWGTEEIATVEIENESVQEQEAAEAGTTEEPTEAMQAEAVPMEQNASEVPLTSGLSIDDLYNLLTAEQKKIDVYAGNQSLDVFLDSHSEQDYISTVEYIGTGIVPDSENLDAQAGTLVSQLLARREGDLNFYSLSQWKLWKVNGSGVPQSSDVSHSSLGRVATAENFKNAAYLVNEGTDTNPSVSSKRPVLEPVWSCISYPIPVYGADGAATGDVFTVNAENYNEIAFPAVKADYWKLIYDGTEYRLNTAGEVWTNGTNGIRTVGRLFDETKAKLQACVDSTVEAPKYEVAGQQGKNGWYISDVTILAKDGYQIRLAETDLWSAVVAVTESGEVTLYVKAADGTGQTAEKLTFFIDKTAPVISGVENGQTYYGNQVAVITDEHLQTVTKNGVGVELQENNTTAYIALNPFEEAYIILAEDMAGNQAVYTLWVKNEELPPALQEGTAEFVQPDWYEGQPKPEPVVSSETNGTENITYYYKEQGADDSAYTTTVPDKVGKYTAKAVFAATEVYQEVIRISNFEILPNVPADKTAPVISGVSDGETYYGNQKVTVTDENLHAITVNGEAVEVANNRADITLKPAEDVYKIIAADKAGNKTECTVEVLETWVRDGITTNGIKKLRRERIYKLGSGRWTIDGDSTVYSGGRTFYVKNGGEYNFKRK